MRRFANCLPDRVEILKPAVGRRLISHAAPDPLLRIQAWLVAGEIVQVEAGVRVEERLHLLPAMPSRPIDIEPESVAPKPAIHMPKPQQESSTIATWHLDHAIASQQGSHPAREVEPLAVLAGSGNAQPLLSFGPPPAQPGMERKPRLIQEGHGLPRPQACEFFLTPAGSAGLRWLGLAGRRDSRVSAVAQLVHPVLSLANFQRDPKLAFQMHGQGGAIPLHPREPKRLRGLFQVRSQRRPHL